MEKKKWLSFCGTNWTASWLVELTGRGGGSVLLGMGPAGLGWAWAGRGQLLGDESSQRMILDRPGKGHLCYLPSHCQLN